MTTTYFLFPLKNYRFGKNKPYKKSKDTNFEVIYSLMIALYLFKKVKNSLINIFFFIESSITV